MSRRSRRGRLAAALALTSALFGSTLARAQSAATDGNSTAPFGAPMDDQRVYVHGLLNQFEARLGASQNGLRWEGEGWVGTDTNRLWIKSESYAQSGRIEDGQQELLYARPISPYFDLQAGVRYHLDSEAGRSWAALGVEGLAPEFFQVSATAYASDEGHLAAKFTGAYELLLTQRLILEPQAELNVYSRPDPARGTGSGLSDIDAGIRVRYEFSHKLAPYIGLAYDRRVGQSARYTSLESARESELRAVLGLRTWF